MKESQAVHTPHDPCLLSVVAASRNDDHGGNLLFRMQHFVDSFVEQCRRHRLPAELILVEWNPAEGRAPLRQGLKWPKDPGPCSIRIITVPRSIHERLAHSGSLPLFQMIAKNVGLRRARGEFLLATNIDILFSDSVMRFMRDRLRPGRVYRSDRCDVTLTLPLGSPLEAILAFCQAEMFRINTRNATLVRVNGKWKGHSHFRTYLLPLLKVHLKHRLRQAGSAARRFRWHNFHSAGEDWSEFASLWLADLRFAFLLARRRWAERSKPFTNACGDFTLMSRDDWFRLRGYPEWEMFSWHLDSVLLYQARRSGLSEVYLGWENWVYHMEHGLASGYTPEGAGALFQKMERLGVPYLSMMDFERIVDEMDEQRRRHSVVTYNGEGWGLAHSDLPEETVCCAPTLQSAATA